jgi:hypothetical protein
MATVLWDRKGVLMVEFMQKCTTVRLDMYCETLKKKKRLCRAGHSEQKHGMLTCGVVLVHDNVYLHTVAHIRALKKHFNWELFDHPSHGPDLALSNYHLFTCPNNWLGSQHFNNNE